MKSSHVHTNLEIITDVTTGYPNEIIASIRYITSPQPVMSSRLR